MKHVVAKLRLPGEVTGRTVLACVLAFFAVVIVANLVMVGAALTTFRGLETRNAYQAGLAFSREIAAARAQDARHWRVDARVLPRGEGGVTVLVEPRDEAGRILSGIGLAVTLVHPADRHLDRVVEAAWTGPGIYRGEADVAPGQWDLVIEIEKDGERLFRSRNRVQVR